MPDLSRARVAVTAVFVAHGLVFTSWLPHIPLVKNDLGLSDGGLGLVLLAPPAGALIALTFTGAACARWGSAAVTRVTLAGYCAGVVVIGIGDGAVLGLALALALAGGVVGSLDVAMNAQAAAVERAMGKSVMGSFHAAWALAAAVGAGLGGLGAQWGVELWTQLLVLGVAAYAAVVRSTRAFVAEPPPVGGGSQRRWRFETGLVVLAIVAFAGILAEAAAADWSAVYLSQVLSASPLTAACGYGAFALFMFVGRLAGDQLVRRVGSSRSLSVAAGVGGAGMGVGLAASSALGPGPAGQAAVIGGLCMLGLGLAVVVPIVFSAAGDGPGIATVSSGGAIGGLLGPALIGGAAEWQGLTTAMWTIPVLTLIAGAVAPFGIRALRRTAPEPVGLDAAR